MNFNREACQIRLFLAKPEFRLPFRTGEIVMINAINAIKRIKGIIIVVVHGFGYEQTAGCDNWTDTHQKCKMHNAKCQLPSHTSCASIGQLRLNAQCQASHCTVSHEQTNQEW